MIFGSLFSGIGGLDLGLERSGMTCAWQVENNPYASKVLAKHWPKVRRHDDVQTFPPSGEWGVDLIAGGFPCQDVSLAGARAGIDGARSGLWREFARIVRVLQPRIVLVENTPGLLSSGFGRVLGDLAESGYDAEWDCIPAAAFGAPHLRYRVFIVAYLDGSERRPPTEGRHEPERSEAGRAEVSSRLEVRAPIFAHAHGEYGRAWRPRGSSSNPERPEQQAHGIFSDAEGAELQDGKQAVLEESGVEGIGGVAFPGFERCANAWWATEPDVVRMVSGIPKRVDRIRGLGNAVVPQVAEWIGRRIMECEP